MNLNETLQAPDAHSYVHCDALAALVGRSPLGQKKIGTRKDRKDEWVAATAWDILAEMATRHPEDLEENFATEQIVLSDKLHKKAVVATKKNGKVEVDHGETDCKTPGAIPFMQKMRARAKKVKP